KVTDGKAPVSNATLALYSNCGGLSPSNGTTDLNGSLKGLFIAPSVESETMCRITAQAKKESYLDGYGYADIIVTPPAKKQLFVRLKAEPEVVNSSELSTITLYVHDETGKEIESANVSLTTELGGFYNNNGTTDIAGKFQTLFVAPILEFQSITRINAIATKDGCKDGFGFVYITILPPQKKRLIVDIISEETVIDPARNLTLTIKVSDGTKPVSDVELTLSTSIGELSKKTGKSDANGIFETIFIAPPVDNETIVRITAQAKKENYLDGFGYLDIIIAPKIYPRLIVSLIAEPDIIKSNETANILVLVSSNSEKITDAKIFLSAESGTLLETIGKTDNGTFKTLFKAPNVIAKTTYKISVQAMKIGYVGAFNHTYITVLPPLAKDYEVSIKNDTELSGITTISGSVNPDSNILWIEGKIDDGEWFKINISNETNLWSYQIDTTKLDNGLHRLYLRAFNGTNYTDERMIPFIVYNEKPVEKVVPKIKKVAEPINPLLFLIGLITGIVFAMAYAMYTRRKGKVPPLKPEEKPIEKVLVEKPTVPEKKEEKTLVPPPLTPAQVSQPSKEVELPMLIDKLSGEIKALKDKGIDTSDIEKEFNMAKRTFEKGYMEGAEKYLKNVMDMLSEMKK
ncbi:MAG: Ig-like domain-containing protein, partial [Candidatus Thermoplasmatota archaeon]